MTRASLAFCLVVWAPGSALRAQTQGAGANPSPFKTSYIGEGGSYTHPGGEASDAMETGARQDGGHGTLDQAPAGQAPEAAPAGESSGPTVEAAAPIPEPDRPTPTVETDGGVPTASADSPGSGSERERAAAPKGWKPTLEDRVRFGYGAPRPAADQPAGKPEGGAADRRRYSMWEGLTAPMQLPTARVGELPADKATELGRQDYESHILGGTSASAPPAPGSQALAASQPEAAPAQVGRLFVSLDLKTAPEQLRDAVAGLAQASGFSRDERFAPKPESNRVSVWGWLPADRLAEALRDPSVARLQIESGAPGSAASGAESQVLVGLRLPAAASESDAAAQRTLRSLSDSAGFVWKATIGTQRLPGSEVSALIVAGAVPVNRLSRLLAHPEVIKIAPAPAPALDDDASPDAPRPTALRRFVSFAAERAPWLLLLTLLAALPAAGGWLFGLLEAFVPYKKR